MGSTSPNVPDEVLEYLRGENILTLATSSRAGVPHAATLLFVNDGLVLYCWTRPDSTTAKHIEQNPTVAFVVNEYNPDWSKTKGIQGMGDCNVLLSPNEISRVTSLFHDKFQLASDPRRRSLSFIRITPTSVQYIDNESSEMQPGRVVGAEFHRSMVYNIFRQLPRHDAEAVMARLDIMQVNPRDVVVRQGAPADKFFIIASGEVEVVREEEDGQERVVTRLQEGQFFGEMAILRDMPRTATVRATKPTTLLAMDRDAFRGLIAQSLGTTDDFDKVVQQRLDQLAALTSGA